MLVRKLLATAMATAALSTAFAATDAKPAYASKGCEVNPGLGNSSGGVYANARGECSTSGLNLTITVYMTRSGKTVGPGATKSSSNVWEIFVSHPATSNPKGKQKFCAAAFLYKNEEIVDKRGICDYY